MDFQFTPEDEAFRQEVREFISREWQGELVEREYSDAAFEAEREFEKKLAQKGWLTMAWPKEYGGLEASHVQQLIFKEETAYARAPGGGGQGIGLIGPCIMVHGTEEQKRRFLPPIARAEVVWCQGFSEPGAGSDLASLQTRATRDGDDFIINGQKIWTSNAHRADWIHVLARSDPDAPKHRGISYFLVPMDSPGISIQPIVQMTGQAGFNQTFFDNVRVPRENMLGEENRGWYVAATTLDFERSGIQRIAGGLRTLDEFVQYARETRYNGGRLIDEPTVKHKLAELRIELEIGRLIAYRVAWMQSQGLIPNYEASMSKLYGSELQQRLALFGVHLLGQYGILHLGEKKAPWSGRAGFNYLAAVPATIAAGTSEVQRNIIATRGLGLPRG